MNPYDEVPYPTLVQEQTHPDRMHVVSSLFGLNPAAVDRCRVLEIGCGNGGNLIPVAYCCPDSTFLGIDLAEAPVRRGTATIRDLGLQNIRIEVRDLSTLDAGFGKFDYIVAHGVYAWVPENIREALLNRCAELLSPHGIAFISYNTLPGGHLRRVARDLMRFHTRKWRDDKMRIEQAHFILNFATESTPNDGYYRAVLQERRANIARSNPNALFHDDLAEVYEPVYFEDFLRCAARHGLAYVGEADFFELSDGQFAEEVREGLDALSGGDPLVKEQYMDFLSGRAFRQTLLCKSEVQPQRRALAERIRPFYVSTVMTAGERVGEFVGPKGATIHTNHPLLQQKLKELSALWPGSLPVASVTGGDPQLENFWLQLYAANLVKFHTQPAHFTLQPGERPEASTVARYQAARGEFVSTLAQYPARIVDETARRFLLKLDGTRTRQDLALEMERPIGLIEQNLSDLARMALIRS